MNISNMSSAKLLCVLIIFDAALLLNSMRPWSKIQIYPSHKIPDGALSTERAIVKSKIVKYHNFFRSKVSPTASNMLKMSWHPEAAEKAQRYANKCIFLQHNDPSENRVQKLGNCGQNLFVSAQKTPWFFALQSWFVEYENFTYGFPVRNLKAVGHYTQMVWATSHKVGCGVAHCPGGPWGQFYNYVCHYCPAGNYDSITQFPYKVGPPCADCPHHCENGTLCTNPCSEVDHWSNCEQLRSVLNVCEQTQCKASCQCGGSKIYKNYPF